MRIMSEQESRTKSITTNPPMNIQIPMNVLLPDLIRDPLLIPEIVRCMSV